MKFKDDIPEKYKSKIMTLGYLRDHEDHKSRLEIEFENGMKLTLYDVPEKEYQSFNSCRYGWEYYFSDIIYPNYKNQIEMIKN